MNSRTSPDFREMYRSLPHAVRKQAYRSFQLFLRDPRHPSLHLKKINARHNVYSARINDDYRALAHLDEHGLLWFWIGPHHEYDRLLRHM